MAGRANVNDVDENRIIYDVTFQFHPVLMVVKDNTNFYQNQWEKHLQYDYPEGYSQQLQLVRPLTQS